MKKLTFVVSLLMIFLCVLSACSRKKAYEFINDESEISAIEIVKLCEYDQEKGEYQEQLISTVEDHETFLSDFKEIDCYNHWSDPTGVFENDIVIKISYTNGEYELIHHSGQGKYRHFEDNPSFLQVYAGRRYIDEEQFNQLIDKYSSKTIHDSN
ncbi:MAG: hypothetical protein IKC75_06905 [Clostridia bacterium]|nr:hypothetical protein [Clostridia bacterium]